MIQRKINIGKIRLSGDASKDVPTLKDAVAKFEEHIYEKSSDSSDSSSSLIALTAQVQALQTTVAGLQVSQFPGFGTDHNTAAYGDHQHSANKFFSKKGTQAAVLGTNTVTFDTTVPFTTLPIVHAWLIYGDGSWGNTVPTITATGFTISVKDTTDSPVIYYSAIGS